MARDRREEWRCSICLKTFGRKADLTRHKAIHSGLRPYVCEFCGADFVQCYALKTHWNVHTGAKPHKCGLGNCPAAFGDPSSRSRHRQEAHRHIGRFHCPVQSCSSKIKRRSAFVNHLRKHRIDPNSFSPDDCFVPSTTAPQPPSLNVQSWTPSIFGTDSGTTSLLLAAGNDSTLLNPDFTGGQSSTANNSQWLSPISQYFSMLLTPEQQGNIPYGPSMYQNIPLCSPAPTTPSASPSSEPTCESSMPRPHLDVPSFSPPSTNISLLSSPAPMNDFSSSPQTPSPFAEPPRESPTAQTKLNSSLFSPALTNLPLSSPEPMNNFCTAPQTMSPLRMSPYVEPMYDFSALQATSSTPSLSPTWTDISLSLFNDATNDSSPAPRMGATNGLSGAGMLSPLSTSSCRELICDFDMPKMDSTTPSLLPMWTNLSMPPSANATNDSSSMSSMSPLSMSPHSESVSAPQMNTLSLSPTYLSPSPSTEAANGPSSAPAVMSPLGKPPRIEVTHDVVALQPNPSSPSFSRVLAALSLSSSPEGISNPFTTHTNPFHPWVSQASPNLPRLPSPESWDGVTIPHFMTLSCSNQAHDSTRIPGHSTLAMPAG